MSKMFNKGKNIYFYAILNMSVLTQRNVSFLDQTLFSFCCKKHPFLTVTQKLKNKTESFNTLCCKVIYIHIVENTSVSKGIISWCNRDK